VNVDVLRTHLVDELHIPADQVKVATGTQRELDGLNLSARGPVRYIITMQALREGWDCPFAYLLCSVQSVRSATAIEQLLGRVLRMPYASRRQRAALNKAYAHVTETETGMAANALADRLIDGMGFDPLDMASMIAPQLPLPGLHDGEQGARDDGPLFAARPAHAVPQPSMTVDLPADKPLPAAWQRLSSKARRLSARIWAQAWSQASATTPRGSAWCCAAMSAMPWPPNWWPPSRANCVIRWPNSWNATTPWSPARWPQPAVAKFLPPCRAWPTASATVRSTACLARNKNWRCSSAMPCWKAWT